MPVTVVRCFKESKMRSAHVAYMVLGLLAAFGAAVLAVEAYKLLLDGRSTASLIAGIGGALAYLAFLCGRMGTSNFKL
jgi:hypothetical protein